MFTTYRQVATLAAALLMVSCGTTTQYTEDDGEPQTAADFSYEPHLEERSRDLVPTSHERENVLLAGGRVMTATGEVIDDGWVWLQDGVIAAVSAEEPDAPGADVIDVSGKVVTPGIIDTHSHLGVYPSPYIQAHSDGNEATSPTTPQVDAIHSVWPQDPGFQTALEGGITTLQILPGSANLIGGQTVTLQLHPGVSSRAMVFPDAPTGMKMACGENPKRVYGGRGQMPSTRMGSYAAFRKAFQRAVELRRQYDKYEREMKRWLESDERDPKKKPQEPTRDFALEPLMAVMEGDILVHIHCYRADEMIQMLQLADEFGFDVRSFHHAVEAYKIRDILAEWDVGVSTWADWWGFKIEAHDAILENAGLLEEAGARAIIHSDSSIGIQRLNQEAAKAFYAAKAAGLEVTESEALQWITANPAWALGIDDVTGTLEKGKRADVVVWSENPFSVYAKPELVFVDGVREHDADETREPWSDFEVYQLPRAPDGAEEADGDDPDGASESEETKDDEEEK